VLGNQWSQRPAGQSASTMYESEPCWADFGLWERVRMAREVCGSAERVCMARGVCGSVESEGGGEEERLLPWSG
jgi:hypothetical protein